MATGSPGTNGVWQYGEDDSEATFSALLNKAASTTDTAIGLDRGRLTNLEARRLSGLVPVVAPTVQFSGGTATANTSTTVTFPNGSTSVSLNGVFSAAFRSYRVLININQASALATVWFRLRASGTDGAGPVYGGANTVNQVGTTAVLATNGGGNVQIGFVSALNTGGKTTSSLDVHKPFLTLNKNIHHQHAGIDNSFVQMTTGSSLYESSTACDGLTLTLSTGNFGGTIAVYGYTN